MVETSWLTDTAKLRQRYVDSRRRNVKPSDDGFKPILNLPDMWETSMATTSYRARLNVAKVAAACYKLS
jgi:hypothetical protein